MCAISIGKKLRNWKKIEFPLVQVHKKTGNGNVALQ